MFFRLLLLYCLYLTVSCSNGLNKHDEQHLSTRDKVELVRPVDVQDLRSHVIFQDKKIIKEDDLEPYRTSCIFEVHQLGPKTYQPAEFNLSRIETYEEMYSDAGAVVRYFTEFYLASGTKGDSIILTCQVLDDTMQFHSFPLYEIKRATGDYFKF